ncbi:hypothetical protein [Frankia sp. Cppng1_Ct_nod]|uniref:hypothetical protein n=1 Tax=Frankia sp. Cppng1_Ct_nod TaxID=2897162 RepID=UPI001F5FABE4|nr:hypothetical protein [Frankia sp. Cppng1_Ct_nod]
MTYAEEQRDVLPGVARRELHLLLDVLTADPQRHGTYSKREDQWSASMSPFGVMLYTVEERWLTITVLRVLWLE